MGLADAAFAAASWVVAAGFYVLLAGAASPTELSAAVPVGLLAALAAAALRRESDHTLRLHWGAAPATARAIGSVVPDTFRVGRALLRALLRRPPGQAGAFARQAFRPGGDNADDAGRRAVVILGLSLAPNGYVLDQEEDGSLLMHRLVAARSSPDREWPS